MRVLDEQQTAVVRRVCEAIVPGCDRIGAEVYVDALLAGMPVEVRGGVVGAFQSLVDAVDAGEEALRERQFTPEFGLARALACEAFYSDFVAPGRVGPGAWEEIDFRFPLADRINKDWSFLGVAG
jgi:hypothetical protein